ncbi:hypothetical protein Drose_15350 [Dactylosporangium roseum]|uniref:Uncharacterized protein n=1 Tax=Dactylosporangium roseum TaxID=47989 RepID=A0ABY5ZBJ4_9ACTN|nr:hypothetical protein [Dactylosporangium roseum]UWZ39488.1 hypothetical protein Drose_15350 [Dactylosporangium roseum]
MERPDFDDPGGLGVPYQQVGELGFDVVEFRAHPTADAQHAALRVAGRAERFRVRSVQAQDGGQVDGLPPGVAVVARR